jgi:FkbM family methyltransferase
MGASSIFRQVVSPVGRAVAPLRVRGIPRVLYSLRRMLRSSDLFELGSGLKLRLNLDDYVESMMFWGIYQSDIFALLRKVVRNGAVIIDGGAHIGYLSLELARLAGRRGHVYSFEPDPRPFARMEDTVSLNGMQDRITMFSYALGATSGDQTFYLCPTLGWSTAVPNSHLLDLVPTTVRSVSLDSLVQAGDIPSKVDFIKLDLEGFECEALRGMTRLLSQDPPFVLSEVNCLMLKGNGDSADKLFSMFRSLGYEVYLICTSRRLYGVPYMRLEKFDRVPTAVVYDVLAVPSARIDEIAEFNG